MKYLYWLRLRFKHLLCRYRCIIEFCRVCGIKQPLVWTADDKLWQDVTGINNGSGILCPRCFDKQAISRGIYLRWIPILQK
jgi:hypothetical protein